MSAFIFGIISYVLLYKYVALFIVAYFAALLLPLPSNTSLLAASAFASQGYLNIFIVLGVAFLANVLGDITGFYIARRYGKGMLTKLGMGNMFTSKKYRMLERFFLEHTRSTIFVTRFVGQVGPLVNILAGISEEVSFRTFFIYEASGELLYVLVLGLLGYFVGSAWETITSMMEWIGVGFLLVACFFIIKKVYFSPKK